MYREWIEVLSSSLLFKGIDAEALNIMLECLNPRIKRYKNREIIAVYGSPFYGIGVVVSGKVALTKETYSGNRIIIEVLEAKDIFGETLAFSDEKLWPVTVIAREDCCLLFLPPDKILGNCSNVCPAHSVLIMNMLNILSNKTLTLNKRIEHLSAKNIRSRIGGYLLEESRRAGKSEFILPMKRHELADYLGIPRPSLSRQMSFMQDEGLIEFNGFWIKINDVITLESVIG